MKPTVKLSDLYEQIDLTSYDAVSFYNELTGEFYYYHEGFTENEHDLDEEEGWLLLPSQRDADEYRMMSDFADSVKNPKKRQQLENALSGKGAFRRFKDAVDRQGIAEAWYTFREKRYLEFALDWCREKEIPCDPAELSREADGSSLAYPGIYPDKIAIATTTVTKNNTAKAVGSGSLDVFATPMLLALMEQAACACLEDALEPGQTSVGTAIDLCHSAASPVGAEITAIAVVERIEGKKVLFRVTACDPAGEIGQGTHERVIVAAELLMTKTKARRQPPKK